MTTGPIWSQSPEVRANDVLSNLWSSPLSILRIASHIKVSIRMFPIFVLIGSDSVYFPSKRQKKRTARTSKLLRPPIQGDFPVDLSVIVTGSEVCQII